MGLFLVEKPWVISSSHMNIHWSSQCIPQHLMCSVAQLASMNNAVIQCKDNYLAPAEACSVPYNQTRYYIISCSVYVLNTWCLYLDSEKARTRLLFEREQALGFNFIFPFLWIQCKKNFLCALILHKGTFNWILLNYTALTFDYVYYYHIIIKINFTILPWAWGEWVT